MSRLVSRILLSIFMFPLAGLFFLLTVVIAESTMRGSFNSMGYRHREFLMFLSSGIFTSVFVATYWCLLWKGSVLWTRRRIVRTLLSAVGAMAVGTVIGVILAAVMPMGDGSGFGAFVGGVLTIVLWLVATVFVWRETALERARRISSSSQSAITCPSCGYNLTGLSETRCPECGTRFTLDELIALQPKAEVEIE